MTTRSHKKERPSTWSTPLPFATSREKEERPTVPVYLRKDGEYLAANCVVLAAAVCGERWAAYEAERLLPAARIIDAQYLK